MSKKNNEVFNPDSVLPSSAKRFLNQFNAYYKGKRASVTIKNPDTSMRNEPYVKVNAKDYFFLQIPNPKKKKQQEQPAASQTA